MGGQLFAVPGSGGQPALNVPRIPTHQYNELKAKYHAIISEYYEKISTLVEAPGKEDHGDIDIMVAGPKMGITPEDLASRLQAVRKHRNGPTCSFAVPLSKSENTYLQLDINLCHDGQFEWEYFMNSYGDLWQILGILLRTLGLTANDHGLNLRVKEIESRSRKASKVTLSKDPD